MKVVFNKFAPDEEIPVLDYIRNRKMLKYYNREARAALVTIGMLFREYTPNEDTPLFYSVGKVENDEFDIHKIARNSRDAAGRFSNQEFVEKGMMQISPLTQFKVLYNMILCYISIEHQLTGDNAVLYSSASGLLNYALCSPTGDEILIGTGKVSTEGGVESGFAAVTKSEILGLPMLNPGEEATVLFQHLVNQRK